MKPNEDKPPWWSYVPDFPKPAILLLALLTDLVLPGTWLFNHYSRDLDWLQAIINQNPMANLAAILALFQLNFEVVYMFLTKRRNQTEKEAAVAAAVKQAEARTEARIETRVQSWYEAHKDQMGADVPPPPLNGHRNGDADR